jgi:hypothetical protein
MGRRDEGAEGRAFSWFEPAGRRATVYEDVTIDTQPSVDRHLRRGWPMFFEDGRGTWDEGSTRLRCSDWYAFRDPGQMWERPYYQRGTATERESQSAMDHGRDARLLADFRPEWVDALRDVLQVPAFVAHGVWLATATVARDCLSDTIATCMAFTAAMKQRQAQALVLYGMDLEPHLGEFAVEAAKERWLTEPAWQPARAYVERLRTITDWGETVVAANLVFEPLVERLLRRELLVRCATANGDSVTPGVLRGAEHEGDWIVSWGAALVRLALDDAEHGQANRAVLGEWVQEWTALATEAARALEPVFAALPSGVPFADAVANVEQDFEAGLANAGLVEAQEPAEVPA